MALLVMARPAIADSPTNGPFTVKLNRPSHVGDTDTLRIRVSQERVTRVTQAEKTLQDEQSFREVSGTFRARVLQVSSDGKVLHERVQILSLAGRTAPGAKGTPLPLTGVALDVTLAPKVAIVRADGKSLDASVLPYLELIFTPADSRIKKADDAIFGPGRPVRVGDTWPINTEKMAAQLSQKGDMQLLPKDMASQFLLSDHKMIGGIDCLVVHGTLDVNNLVLKTGSSPQQSFSGQMHVTFDTAVPVDAAKDVVASEGVTMEMTLSGKVPTPQGGEADLTMSEKDAKEQTRLSGGT